MVFNMIRYSIKISNTKYPLKVVSINNNHLVDQSKYLQLLGFSKVVRKKCTCISFWELHTFSLDKLVGYHPVLLKTNGVPKTLSSTVISITKETI